MEHITNHIYTAIEIAEETGNTIVLPEDGIGTGKAQLEKRAPKIYAFLQQELNKLKNLESFDSRQNFTNFAQEAFKCK